MPKVLFKGKVDEGDTFIRLNVLLPDVVIDLLMLFILQENKRGIIIIANSSTTDYDMPLSFVSGCGYHLEMYGLQKKTLDEKHYYELAVYKRSQFTVQKSTSETDWNFEYKLDDQRISYVPLSFVTENEESVHYYFEATKNRLKFFIQTGKQLKYTIPFDLPPAAYCDVKFVIGNKLQGNKDIQVFHTEMNSTIITFKTFFTLTEYEKLFERTKHFLSTRKGMFYPIEYFYRNKSEMYYSSVREYHKGIMRPYKKDHNGDPFSIINGCIDGLFFSTAVEFNTGKPPPFSLYGPIRLYLEAATLFNPNCNLYFADFYCHYQVHYVTIILTPKRSPTDEFCKPRLIKLDIYNNPFIYLLNRGEDMREVRVFQSNGFRIELLYTEPVHIPLMIRNHQGYFEKVPIIGKGESTPSGIPKNKHCSVCNI